MTESGDGLEWAVNGPPIGVWATTTGTADVLMRDTLSMRPDGTGYLRSQSVLRGVETLPIMWRQDRQGLLKIAMLLPDDDPQDPPEWETVRYAAAVVRSDLGSERVLKNIGDDVFWTLVGPIALVSRSAD